MSSWILKVAFVLSAFVAGYTGLPSSWLAGALAAAFAAALAWWDLRSRQPAAVPKVIDTSVIIDGRIADICQTGFLEGQLIVPGFVLQELQHVADSSDPYKRNRGRRGLDTLAALQRLPGVRIRILSRDYPKLTAVDEKLLRLAGRMRASLLTQDINLNKVAGLQGVKVLNINDLSNAIKAVVLPGEELAVKIIKEGKEPGQGIGYLDDGTMVVVENSRDQINQRLVVTVTSVLQTAAGRMVFAKQKNSEG